MTGDDKGLQGVTRGYRGLQGVLKGYKEFQGVTRGEKGLNSNFAFFVNCCFYSL